jgi:hypothetical protein
VEAYYKKLHDLSEYTLRFAPSFIDNSSYQQFFYNGEGYSRGIDFLLQKKYGILTGWLAYTLGETRYHFPIYGNGGFKIMIYSLIIKEKRYPLQHPFRKR